MTRETLYILQIFAVGKGGALKTARAMQCKTAEDVKRRAKAMAAKELGVVAYSMSGDPDLGDYDETPTILFKAGTLPPQFEE